MDVESEPDSDSLKAWKSSTLPTASRLPTRIGNEPSASVKQLVEEMRERLVKLEQLVAELQAENQLLKEKINRTSTNSSQAPSSDPPSVPKYYSCR